MEFFERRIGPGFWLDVLRGVFGKSIMSLEEKRNKRMRGRDVKRGETGFHEAIQRKEKELKWE